MTSEGGFIFMMIVIMLFFTTNLRIAEASSKLDEIYKLLKGKKDD